MSRSQIHDKWKEFEAKYSDKAGKIKKAICELHNRRGNKQEFDSQLSILQSYVSAEDQRMLGINTKDKKGLALWAIAMKFIFVVKNERLLASGRRSI